MTTRACVSGGAVLVAFVAACSAQTPPPAPKVAKPAATTPLPAVSGSAIPATSVGSAPVSPALGASDGYVVATGESVFRLPEKQNPHPSGGVYLATADGLVQLSSDAAGTTATALGNDTATPAQLFKLPLPLSNSDIQVDPGGQRIALVVGPEQANDGDLYVWSKQTGVRRLFKSSRHRALQRGYLRWSLDGRWLGIGSVERPCNKLEACSRDLVLDASTGAVKYAMPAELEASNITFSADHALICGSLYADLNAVPPAKNGPRMPDIGISGIGEPSSHGPGVTRPGLGRPLPMGTTPAEARDGCRWYGLALATGAVTRREAPAFASPDGKFQVRVDGNQLVVLPTDRSAPFRIHAFEPDLPFVWFSDHELVLRGDLVDISTRTARPLAPAGFRFVVASYDRRTAVLESLTPPDVATELVVAERR